MGTPITVALIDAHTLSRSAMAALLQNAQPDIRLGGMLLPNQSLELWLCSHRPDVLLLDDTFPFEADIYDTLTQIQRHLPQTRVIVISHILYQGYIEQLLNHGMAGFIAKSDKLEEILLSAVHTVYSGQPYLSPTAMLLPYQKAAHHPVNALTPRDFQVLMLLNKGMRVKEIAEVLHTKPAAVYRSRDRLREVLGASTNEHLVRVAHAKGLL